MHGTQGLITFILLDLSGLQSFPLEKSPLEVSLHYATSTLVLSTGLLCIIQNSLSFKNK